MTGYTNTGNTEERNIRNVFSGQKRFIFFAAMFCLAAFVVLVKYAIIMLGPPEPDQVYPARHRLIERGPITDRNGRILALQTRLANISAWRPEITDFDAFCQDLAPVLGYSPEDIRERIEVSSSDFIYLKKQVEQSTIQKIEQLRADKRVRGVGIEPILGRIYPEKRLAGQIIGFVGDENTGLAGIEHAMEEQLVGGSQVVLTVDTNVQYILEGIARRAMVENRAEAVMFLAMDPRTGEILGSASLPDFDPNDIRASNEQSRMDRPAIWAYEPGSVFKVFSLASLLDAGAITDKTTFMCNGYYERITNRGERIVINCLAAHGPVTTRDIVIYSCNAGANYAADRMETRAFAESLKKLGFGSRTGAGNPGETAGFLRPAERWSDRSKPTIAMGQEISVSALQMLQAATVIANDGILVPPHIVSRFVSADGKNVKPFDAAPPRRILKAETARILRSYMRDVTSEMGTGWRANVQDLSMAIKTGTAQITDPRTGAYSSTDFIASCIALLPAEAPSLVLYLVIVKPQGEYLAGRIAAPPIREAAEALVDYLGIPRGRNPQVEHSGSVILPPNNSPVIESTVPDFTGYSKRQILPLILRDDLFIDVLGDGWVKRQDPPPGTPFTEGMTITLELE